MTVTILKIFATVSMLIDHVGYFEGITAFRMIGRLAFPIYLFLIYNGYLHTKNPLWYALRLGTFALASHIPYSFCFYGEVWHSSGNVLFTLLACLLCLWLADTLAKRKWLKFLSVVPFVLVFLLYRKGVISSEYGDIATLMSLVLFLSGKNKGWLKLLTGLGLLIAMNYMHILSLVKILLNGGGLETFALTKWQQIQMLAGLSVPLILLYNGKKGSLPTGKWINKLIQYGFYIFYPAHLLVLGIIYGL